MTDIPYTGVESQIKRVVCSPVVANSFERIQHFVRRMFVLGLAAEDYVIVLINVDDPHGGPLADKLMPNADWSVYRERGETPFARGLAERNPIAAITDIFCPGTRDEIESADGIVVVVVTDGMAAVYRLEDAMACQSWQ